MITPGRIVVYVSKNGDEIESPAIVLRTKETTNLKVLEKWKPDGEGTLSGKGRPVDLVPDLYGDDVDLHVFGLGGTHQQYAVPFSAYSIPHSWHWPERV